MAGGGSRWSAREAEGRPRPCARRIASGGGLGQERADGGLGLFAVPLVNPEHAARFPTLAIDEDGRRQAGDLELPCGCRLGVMIDAQALGPDLGQCCGGRVKILIETFDRRDLEDLKPLVEAEAESGSFEVECRMREELPGFGSLIAEEGRTPRENAGWWRRLIS